MPNRRIYRHFGPPQEGLVMKRVSLLASLGILCYLALVLPAAGPLAAAASTSSVTYQGTPGSATRLTQTASVSSLPTVASAFRNQGPLMFTPVRPSGASISASAGAAAAPAMSTSATVNGT